MLRIAISSTFLLVVWSSSTCAQLLPRLENCLPIPTLAKEIHEKQDPQPPLKTIRFKSVKLKSSTPLPISEKQVLGEMQMSPEIVDSADWPQDAVTTIHQIFQHHGYFRAAVGEPYVKMISTSKTEEVVNLTVHVEAGKQYRLDQIEFANNVTQFDERQLREFFPLAQGQIFDTHKLSRGIETLRRAYGERGFIDFAEVPGFTMDEGRNRISVKIDIDEGKQFRIGAFEILGLDPGVTETLMENSGLKPGSIFNTRLLETFFESNQSVLPAGAKSENDTQRKVDEHRGLVNLQIDFRGCSPAPK